MLDPNQSEPRRSNRISQLDTKPSYTTKSYYRDLNLSDDDDEDKSKYSDDYSHDNGDDVFGGSESDGASINSATYISSGDEDKPAPKIKVEEVDANNDDDNANEHAQDNVDHIEQEHDEDVDLGPNQDDQHIGVINDQQQRHDDRVNEDEVEEHLPGDQQIDNDEILDVAHAPQHQRQQMNGNMHGSNNRADGQTTLDYSFQFTVHKTDNA